MDRWTSLPIICQGGLVLDMDTLTQGSTLPGTARVLQNYEPSVSGGYRRISGYIKWDSDEVPGDIGSPVLGVVVGLGGVFAVRKDDAEYPIVFSAGSGWTTASTAPRTNAVDKARGMEYLINTKKVVVVDGANPATVFDGVAPVEITGTGAPANPKYATTFRNRLVLSGYSTNPSAVSLSAPNDDTNFDGVDDAIEVQVGGEVVGLYTFRDELYIFCDSSIWRLVGQTSDDFQILEVTKRIGCISGDTIQEVGGDLTFLAPDGFRSIAATARIGDVDLGLTSKSIQPLISEIASAGLAENRYSSLVIRGKSQYRVLINQSTYSDDNALGLLGKLNMRKAEFGINYDWATTFGVFAYCADSFFINNIEVAVFGHPNDGYVYRLEQGATFDGRAIIAVFRTPDITFEDATLRKVFQKIDIYTQVEGDITLDMNLILDREEPGIIQPKAVQINQIGLAPVYGSAIYGSSVYGTITFPVYKKNLVGSGFVAAMSFASNSTHPGHRIDSFQIQLAPKGRR